jgi:methylenetetrahydrofolate reductase (NADPH)
MNTQAPDRPVAQMTLASLLGSWSVEVTTRDKDSLAFAEASLPRGAPVFVASLIKDPADHLVAAALRLRRAGLEPVPHIVARNIADRPALEDLVARLAGEAGVRRALVLGGDRDKPAGDFDSSQQLVETGVFARRNFQQLLFACYPEGHRRISDAALDSARTAKIEAGRTQGMEISLVSQFCFDAAPITAFAERIRKQGETAPLFVGVAGPTEHARLVKYALICGVGPSLRALMERQGLAKNMLAGETPERVLAEIAAAMSVNPSLGVAGVHFFTFGSLAATHKWIQQHGR